MSFPARNSSLGLAAAFDTAASASPTSKRKIPAPFSLRLSAEERAILEARAGSQPLGSYIRECLLGEYAQKRRKTRKPQLNDQKIALVLAELGQSRLSSNLNQLAKHANMGTLDVSRDIEQELQDACGAVLAMSEIEGKRRRMAAKHALERQTLAQAQSFRRGTELKARQKRLRGGLGGILDRVSGRYQRIQKQNHESAWLSYKRDQNESDTLIFTQLEARRALQMRSERLESLNQHSHRALAEDRKQYQDIQTQRRERFEKSKRDQRVRSRIHRSYER